MLGIYRTGAHPLQGRDRANRRSAHRRIRWAWRVEQLEGRALLSTWIVDSIGDAGTGSGFAGDLRYCITQVNKVGGDNTIDIQVSNVYVGSALPVLSDTTGLTQVKAHEGTSPSVCFSAPIPSSIYSLFAMDANVDVALLGLKFAGGGATSVGEAIAISNSGRLTMRNCTISNNLGRGIRNDGDLTMTSTTIEGCHTGNGTGLAGGQGGGIYNAGPGTVNMTNCTITGNTAAGRDFEVAGGGIFNTGGTMTIINSTIDSNIVYGEGSQGGGGISNKGEITVISSTIDRNQCVGGSISNTGGGISSTGPAATLTLDNTIVALNTGTKPDVDGTVSPSSAYNLIGDGTGLTGISNGLHGNQVGVTDPGLGELADNGGPTQTVALLLGGSVSPDSPAIDRGDPAQAGTTDQRGVSRPQGAGVDIGAYELQAYVVTTTADETNPDDGLLSLREAIDLANAVRTNSSHITFAPGLSGPIQLQPQSGHAGDLELRANVSITGPGASVLSVQGCAGVDGVLSVLPGVKAALAGLTISGGRKDLRDPNPRGGGITNLGTMMITSCAINGCTAAVGGGVCNEGKMIIMDSTIDHNSARGGGGIANVANPEVSLEPPTLMLVNCTIARNEATVPTSVMAGGAASSAKPTGDL
jgi:CSLREA domain-containing protein